MSNFLSFKKVIMHNFGSYNHAEVDLTNKGICAVSGQNHYKPDNALSNGSGKSLIWSAICFTITGETLSGIHSDLKNHDIEENKCYTTLLFSVNNDEYEITRSIAPKSDLQIIKNGADVSGLTFRESEKKLAELLPDLTKDFIGSVVLLGQGMPNAFSKFNPSGRKELLEKLTKSDFMIENIKNKIQRRLDTLGALIRAHEDSLLQDRTKQAEYKRQLENAIFELENTKKPDFDAEIDKSKKLCESIDKDIKELNKAKKDKEAEYLTAQTETANIKTEKQAQINEMLTKYNNAVGPVKMDKAKVEVTISNLNNEIKRLKSIKDVCPTCGQPLKGVHKPDTTEQENQVKTLTESLKPIQDKLNSIEQNKTKYTTEIEEEFAAREREAANKAALIKKDLDHLIDEINDDTHSLYVEQSRYNQMVIDKDNWEKRHTTLQNSVTQLNEDINKLTEKINLTETSKLDLDGRLAVVKKMETLAKRDFRGYLLTNIIAYLDKKAKDYCEIVFGTRNLNVYLDGNALDISYLGKMFDNLSGGEKQRVDVILQFAIRDMLKTYLNASANILVLDEITDFLDKKSCAAMMTLIEKELTNIESVFVISHHADELSLPIDSEIKVIKDTNGISSII